MSRSREIRQLTRKLEERCRFMADTLRFRKLVNEKELADYWPGGDENKDQTVEGWIYCYGQYSRFCDRIPDGTEPQNAASDDEVIKALSDAPQVVTVQSGETMKVYPKAFIPLEVMGDIDSRIEWLAKRREVLLSREDARDLELLSRTSFEMTFLYGVLAWSATHTGRGLPFDESEIPESLPDSVRALSSVDLLTIRNAFITVNALRLAALIQMLKESGGDDGAAVGRQNWQTFFAIKEDETHTAAARLMRDRSLPSLLASSVLVADIRKKAMDEAKRGQPNA